VSLEGAMRAALAELERPDGEPRGAAIMLASALDRIDAAGSALPAPFAALCEMNGVRPEPMARAVLALLAACPEHLRPAAARIFDAALAELLDAEGAP